MIPVIYPGAAPPFETCCCLHYERTVGAKRSTRRWIRSWTTSIDELLSREDVDVVDVCVPNFAHQEIILAALRAGKHVIVDKPLAPQRRRSAGNC